jgi:hypothetical protein
MKGFPKHPLKNCYNSGVMLCPGIWRCFHLRLAPEIQDLLVRGAEEKTKRIWYDSHHDSEVGKSNRGPPPVYSSDVSKGVWEEVTAKLDCGELLRMS